jgi:hypothetical protein
MMVLKNELFGKELIYVLFVCIWFICKKEVEDPFWWVLSMKVLTREW